QRQQLLDDVQCRGVAVGLEVQVREQLEVGGPCQRTRFGGHREPLLQVRNSNPVVAGQHDTPLYVWTTAVCETDRYRATRMIRLRNTTWRRHTQMLCADAPSPLEATT